MNTELIEAKIKMRMEYRCSICGKVEFGDSINLDFVCFSGKDLESIINSVRPKTSAMPIGWSYNGEFSCGCDR